MSRPARIVALLVLVEFGSGILQGGFPVLLPDLADRLRLGAADQSLATGLEFLVSGIAVPVTSRLGDLLGHRRWLRITLVLTFAGFLLTALAQSLPVLLAGRALAGFLACWLPLEFAIVRDALGPDRGGRAVGLLVGSLTLGSIVGAVAVGLPGTDGGGLRPLLYGLAVLPLLGLLLVSRGVPESGTRARGAIDWQGAALLSLGLGLLFGSVSGAGLGAAGVLGLLAGAVLLLGLFVRHELRAVSPLLDLRVLAGRATAPVFALSFLLGCVLYGAQSATLSFQAADPARAGYGLDADSGLLGLLTLPAVAGALLGSLTAHRLGRRFGERAVLTAAFAAGAAGYGAITLHHTGAAAFVLPSLIAGYGGGLGLSLLPALLMRRLPAEHTGVGTGVYNTLKTLAGAATGAAGAAVLDTMLLRADVPLEGAYVTVWASCAVLSAVGVPVALALRGAGRTRGRGAAAEPVAEAA
ncbi:MFS transporter [Streptomyces sp. NPDC051940]|uniref:MFS transporter n=1 Tax=Streptomyces sp. NPDC051940 TaxID=3155675 RepID=UPI003430D6A5